MVSYSNQRTAGQSVASVSLSNQRTAGRSVASMSLSNQRAGGQSVASVSLPQLPAIVSGHVSHSRRMPVRHRFRYRTYQWLVDVDHLPRRRFSAKDHLGLGPSLRDNIATFT
ncbi:MAG: uncharacterized protein QOH84_4686, partial [Kribbellaceae bacterium]|nr:uncharacterized protein [Kribbellaceae bacterium]